MSSPQTTVELSDRDVMYLGNASFLTPELRSVLDSAILGGKHKHILKVPQDVAEQFRAQFTDRLAKAGFRRDYEPTSEGKILEDLIDRSSAEVSRGPQKRPSNLPTLPNGHSDVLIAGGGFAGFALAIALRQALGVNFTVTLADPAVGQAGRDVRASAIAAAPRRMFEALGVWDAVADEAQPILDMVITDSRVHDAVRPVFLTFGGEIEPGEPFAHMIENGRLVAALSAKAVSAGVALMAAAVADFTAETSGVNVTLRNGAAIRTRLLVAADGARSRLRERAGIATYGWSYGQSAIVTTVTHERSHQGRAEEHFLPSGPFAILPLRHNRSSIVWTERTGEAERIVTLPDDEFHHELEKRFGLRLGDIAVSGPRRAYPLGLWVARSFIADRLALVGDAAHVIHPIAGQGLNMGLRDVAALAEAVVDAVRAGLDPGDATVLERYQRWRRFDTMTMCVSTDGLNRLFTNSSDAVRLARDLGLGLVDRFPTLKRLFIREAAGLAGEVPKLLRGESLANP